MHKCSLYRTDLDRFNWIYSCSTFVESVWFLLNQFDFYWISTIQLNWFEGWFWFLHLCPHIIILSLTSLFPLFFLLIFASSPSCPCYHYNLGPPFINRRCNTFRLMLTIGHFLLLSLLGLPLVAPPFLSLVTSKVIFF